MLTYEQASDKIIIALDCSRERAFELADMLAGKATWVKVGMTLFYAEGPAIVDAMHERGLKVFLDLKVHDIPFQVQGAVRSASMTGADIISIHGLGTAPMVEAARKGAEEAAEKRGGDRTRLVAISVLTSMDQEALASIGVSGSIADEVSRLASLAYGAGADGIVCSPQEASQMRELLGPDALIVTPGVRPAGSAVGDQKRIATPAAAIAAGASKLVIGRPITAADDPVAAFHQPRAHRLPRTGRKSLGRKKPYGFEEVAPGCPVNQIDQSGSKNELRAQTHIKYLRLPDRPLQHFLGRGFLFVRDLAHAPQPEADKRQRKKVVGKGAVQFRFDAGKPHGIDDDKSKDAACEACGNHEFLQQGHFSPEGNAKKKQKRQKA